MQLRLTYYRKQILYQYKVYYNISDPEEDQGGTSSEIQKGPSRLGWPYTFSINTYWGRSFYYNAAKLIG